MRPLFSGSLEALAHNSHTANYTVLQNPRGSKKEGHEDNQIT